MHPLPPLHDPRLLDDPVIKQVFSHADYIRFPAGTTLFRQGDPCLNYLVIASGEVKVFSRTESGREIVLYRLYPGDSCILTTSCLFSHTRYPAEGVTETDITAFSINASRFEQALQQSDNFRKLVFQTFSTHMHALIALVEEVAFGKLDQRLHHHLNQLKDADNKVHCTHQQLAIELGSAREVISRQLKEMEKKGEIRLSRGCIELLTL